MDYDIAAQAAYLALDAISRPKLRDILAGDVAACVIGNGTHGADRWAALAAGTGSNRQVVAAVMRDLPDSVTVSSGPIDAAVRAAAEALLNAEEGAI